MIHPTRKRSVTEIQSIILTKRRTYTVIVITEGTEVVHAKVNIHIHIYIYTLKKEKKRKR